MLALVMLQASLPALPIGYLEMCVDRRDGSCHVQHMTADDLAAIHVQVTAAIETLENANPDEPWRVFPRDPAGRLRGDCSDQVATERAILLELGIPAKDLAIETGRVRNADGSETGHVVLIVALDGKRYVLDRRVPSGIYGAEKRPKDYRTTAVQEPGVLLWRPPG